MELKNICFKNRESALDSVDVTIFNVQNSIILIFKIGNLGWIEYIDKNVFTALTYLGFYLEQKVNKYIQVCFLARALFLFADQVSQKYTELVVKRYHCIPSEFPNIMLTTTFSFSFSSFSFVCFFIFFTFFCFLFQCLCFFSLKQKIYILIHIRLCAWPFSGTRGLFLASCTAFCTICYICFFFHYFKKKKPTAETL